MKMHFLSFISATMLFIASCISASAQEPGDAQKGQDLFVGNIRLTNSGPACNSCHNVNMKGFVSGGILAKDLTQAVTRLTENGVKGMMSGLPFPQMRQSYENKPINRTGNS